MTGQTLSEKRRYAEKRNFIRMKVNTPAQVSVEQGDSTIQGICNDLSGGGMLLTLDKKPSNESDLMVTVTSKESNGPLLQARCSIARTQMAAKDKYIIGLEIQEFIEDQKDSVIA